MFVQAFQPAFQLGSSRYSPYNRAPHHPSGMSAVHIGQQRTMATPAIQPTPHVWSFEVSPRSCHAMDHSNEQIVLGEQNERAKYTQSMPQYWLSETEHRIGSPSVTQKHLGRSRELVSRLQQAAHRWLNKHCNHVVSCRNGCRGVWDYLVQSVTFTSQNDALLG